jgi:(1->4)-alpha-D-glucan 1-alpha-D-glucosylmutase
MSALERAGVFAAADAPRRMTVDLMIAVHRFLARTPAAVMAVQLEDVFGQDTQVNLPSTTEDQYPNWRRKLNIPLESWASNRRFAALTRMLRKERRRRARPDPHRAAADGGPRGRDPG